MEIIPTPDSAIKLVAMFGFIVLSVLSVFAPQLAPAAFMLVFSW